MWSYLTGLHRNTHTTQAHSQCLLALTHRNRHRQMSWCHAVRWLVGLDFLLPPSSLSASLSASSLPACLSQSSFIPSLFNTTSLSFSLFLPPSVFLPLLSSPCSAPARKNDDADDDDDVILRPANGNAQSEWKGRVQRPSLELFDAEKTEEEEGEVEEGGGGLVQAEERLLQLRKRGEE